MDRFIRQKAEIHKIMQTGTGVVHHVVNAALGEGIRQAVFCFVRKTSDNSIAAVKPFDSIILEKLL